MGYLITYNGKAVKTYIKDHRTRQGRYFPMLLIVAILFTFACYIRSEHLIPGEQNATKHAISQMIADIEEGEKVRDAFVSFCREILHNAQNPS